jgi:nitrogen regulatory protein PII-like uncharacterized protein
MNFPSEAGVNAFFKKYNGMAPGQFRRKTQKENRLLREKILSGEI